MTISEPFIRRPVMTAVLTLAAILAGVACYFQLPVNDLPAVDYPVIQVDADYPGASPETMAANVATPLERQFMQINGLSLVTSSSSQGHTTLTLQFDLDKTLDGAATDVQAAINQAAGALPVDLPSPPTFSKTNPNDQPLQYIAVTSDSVTPGQLYDYASTQVGQRLSILPGVSRVQIFGSKAAVRIKGDPSAMAARGISVDDLASAIKGGTSTVGAGQFDAPSGTLLLSPHGQLERADAYDDLQNGHVAEVTLTAQEARILMRKGRGTQFDPEVLDVFLQTLENAAAAEQTKEMVLPTAALTADMVLARDLTSSRGVLMLTAGHRLTAS